MVCGSIALYRFFNHQVLLFLLLAVRDFIIAFYFLKRFEKTSGVSRRVEWMSYFSAILPMFYFNPSGHPLFPYAYESAQILAVLGYTFSTFALFDLGKSFGIAPAVRGKRVKTGLYSIVKHPMYIGYAVAEVGTVFLNPVNGTLFAASIGLYWWRATAENRLIDSEKILEMQIA